MSDRAVVTVQVGHYANYVGAHFWNLQEANFVFDPTRSKANDICHDVLFREGRNLQGQETYTPRVVCVDLKGSLGLLPQFGDLYEPPAPVEDGGGGGANWDGGTEVRREEAKEKNDLQKELDAAEEGAEKVKKLYDLNGQVDVWSDYLVPRFHPKTNVVVKEYQHRNALQPFDVFGLGTRAWKSDLQEEVEDRVRSFAEEADVLQGFHLIADCHDAFSGVAGGLADLLADVYPNKTAVAFPVSPAAYDHYSSEANSARFLNAVLGSSALLTCEAVTLMTPLSLAEDTFVLPVGRRRAFPRLNYESASSYHTSAILATALDGMTLPWRSTSRSEVRMAEVASGLSASGRRVAAAEICLPLLDDSAPEHFVDFLHQSPSALDGVPITPMAKPGGSGDVKVQMLSLRGIQESALRPADFKHNQKYSKHPYLNCDSLEAGLRLYFMLRLPLSQTAVSTSPSLCPSGNPYPRLFGVGEENRESISTLTYWQSSESASLYLSSLSDRGRKINLHKMHRFEEAGLEQDELAAIVDGLADVRDNYKETDLL